MKTPFLNLIDRIIIYVSAYIFMMPDATSNIKGIVLGSLIVCSIDLIVRKIKEK